MKTTNNCGTCTMCCKLLAVGELKKPAGQWCPHVKQGHGCGIYETRPPSCRQFECFWLQSQREKDGALPLEFRPDKSKVVLYTDSTGTRLVVEADKGYPNAWRDNERFFTLLGNMAKQVDVCVIAPDRRSVTVFKNMGDHVGRQTVPLSAPNPVTGEQTVEITWRR